MEKESYVHTLSVGQPMAKIKSTRLIYSSYLLMYWTFTRNKFFSSYISQESICNPSRVCQKSWVVSIYYTQAWWYQKGSGAITPPNFGKFNSNAYFIKWHLINAVPPKFTDLPPSLILKLFLWETCVVVTWTLCACIDYSHFQENQNQM